MEDAVRSFFLALAAGDAEAVSRFGSPEMAQLAVFNHVLSLEYPPNQALDPPSVQRCEQYQTGCAAADIQSVQVTVPADGTATAEVEGTLSWTGFWDDPHSVDISGQVDLEGGSEGWLVTDFQRNGRSQSGSLVLKDEVIKDGGIRFTVHGVEVRDDSVIVYVDMQNKNTYAFPCSTEPKLIESSGAQHAGAANFLFDNLAPGATVQGYFHWPVALPEDTDSIRMAGRLCYDKKAGTFAGIDETFDLTSEVAPQPDTSVVPGPAPE